MIHWHKWQLIKVENVDAINDPDLKYQWYSLLYYACHCYATRVETRPGRWDIEYLKAHPENCIF